MSRKKNARRYTKITEFKGNTTDIYLSKTRDKKAAKRFFKKVLRSFYFSEFCITTVDKYPAYPIVIEAKKMPTAIQLRQVEYLNNTREQNHRFIKKRVRSMLVSKPINTATSILSGIEEMHMIKRDNVFYKTELSKMKWSLFMNY